jgi:hypothetical protein
MSQSASFYSIAADDFLMIEKSGDKDLDLTPFIKAQCTLEGTAMGLEFTLVKDLDEESVILIEEIFNPSESFGGADFSEVDIDTIDPEVLETMVMNDSSVYYLPPEVIHRISELLDKITEADIAMNYNPAALTENDIYPGLWHMDEGDTRGFNSQHLIKDYIALKTFLKNAAAEKDYVITYVGL